MGRKPRFSRSVGGPVAAEAVREAIEAERLGYDFIWVADHIVDIPPITAVFDSWTMLAFIGAKTRRIMLASGVTDIQRMHPAKAASTVATLDNLTNGRAVLGIGAGEVMNVRPYGMRWESPEKRVARFREYLQVVRALWSTSYENPVSRKGDSYPLVNAHLGLQPLRRPHPPIYVGAFASERMLRAAGELADGWFPGAFFTPPQLGEKIEVIREAANKAKRKFRAFDVMANVPVILDPDARTLKKAKTRFKRSLVINKYMLKLLGEDDAYEKVSQRLQYQLITPTRRYDRELQRVARDLPVSDESLERGIRGMMAVGKLDDCLQTFENFVKAGATHLHISSYVAGREPYRRIAEKIIPHFR